MPSAVFTSHPDPGGRGSTPVDDLMLLPSANGLHPFLPRHLNRKGAENVNYNCLVRSRERTFYIQE